MKTPLKYGFNLTVSLNQNFSNMRGCVYVFVCLKIFFTIPISPYIGIASSATGLRCYQCTSDESGNGACVDTPNTRDMQVVEDCKGTCYVSTIAIKQLIERKKSL